MTVTAATTSVAASSGPQLGDTRAGLTLRQRRLLTPVLNRLIPADGPMPSAGDVDVGAFIDEALVEAPYLKRHVANCLAQLEAHGKTADELGDAEVDRLLRRLERHHKKSFDLLLEIAYVGYYSQPRVLQVIG